MPYTQEHKQRTRERILASASKLFSRQGYDSVSINDLMQDAGLTEVRFTIISPTMATCMRKLSYTPHYKAR